MAECEYTLSMNGIPIDDRAAIEAGHMPEPITVTASSAEEATAIVDAMKARRAAGQVGGRFDCEEVW